MEKKIVLYYVLVSKKSEELKLLQSKIYQMLPSERYNPEGFNFNITSHIDKDYNKIITMKKKILENFTPFEMEVDTFGLYEIYPAKLVKRFKEEK